MSKTWLVARREYIENVKTRAFLIGLLLMPVFFGGMLFLPILLEKKAGPDKVTVAVADAGNGLLPEILRKAEAHNARTGSRPKYHLETIETEREALDALKDRLSERVKKKELTGFLLVEPGIVEGKGRASYHTLHSGLFEVARDLGRWLNDVAQEARLRERGLDEKFLSYVLKTVPLDERTIGKEAEAGSEAAKVGTILVPVIFVTFLFVGIMTVAQGCLMSLIEEKSNRIVEVILASISPFQFMTGKILGMGLVGLTLLGSWGVAAYAAAAAKGYTRFFPLDNFGFFLPYFVLGFLLYAALFSAVGSACNTLKEAQNLMQPLTLFLVVPMVLMMPITKDPGGSLATALSYFPFFTPFVMMNRLAASPRPGGLEVALSLAVLALGVFAVMAAAGRIFRVGILMYGKPPRPRELLRWLRTR